MKKWNFLAFAIGVVALSACSDADNLYDPDKAMERKLAMYEAAFAKEFGKIAPNQDWGFGSVETRADKDFVMPAVTEEEKEAVMEWFEKNPAPADYAMTLPWSDFYVQNVYKTENKGQRLKKIYWKSENDSGWDKGLESGKNDNKKDEVVTGMQGEVFFGCDDTGNGKNVMTGNHVIVEINGSYYIRFKVGDEEWILKLSPAQYPGVQRVIAEDLGTTGDFDFNDVVFDVSSGNNRTIITVRAAGGTLPLTVAGREVHELFGVGVTEMVNTIPDKKRLMPIVFSIDEELTANAVEITVNGYNAEEVYTLTADMGSAPQKLCVDTDFEWMEETKSLKEKYPNFEGYVSNPSLNKWWKN